MQNLEVKKFSELLIEFDENFYFTQELVKMLKTVSFGGGLEDFVKECGPGWGFDVFNELDKKLSCLDKVYQEIRRRGETHEWMAEKLISPVL